MEPYGGGSTSVRAVVPSSRTKAASTCWSTYAPSNAQEWPISIKASDSFEPVLVERIGRWCAGNLNESICPFHSYIDFTRERGWPRGAPGAFENDAPAALPEPSAPVRALHVPRCSSPAGRRTAAVPTCPARREELTQPDGATIRSTQDARVALPEATAGDVASPSGRLG